MAARIRWLHRWARRRRCRRASHAISVECDLRCCLSGADSRRIQPIVADSDLRIGGLRTEAIEIFVVAVAEFISADELGVILVATHRVGMHHSLVPSQVGLEESVLLHQVPELPGRDLIGHPAPQSLT